MRYAVLVSSQMLLRMMANDDAAFYTWYMAPTLGDLAKDGDAAAVCGVLAVAADAPFYLDSIIWLYRRC